MLLNGAGGFADGLEGKADGYTDSFNRLNSRWRLIAGGWTGGCPVQPRWRLVRKVNVGG